MLGPQQTDFTKFNPESYTDFSAHKLEFIERFVKAYELVPGMKDVLNRMGMDGVVDSISRSYDALKDDQPSIDDINGLSIQKMLRYFIGDGSTPFEDYLVTECENLAKWLKEHFRKLTAPVEQQPVEQQPQEG